MPTTEKTPLELALAGRWESNSLVRLLTAWRKADRTTLVRVAHELAPEPDDASRLLAELALAMRQGNVAVLGESEVFVVPGPDGSAMRQVRRAVPLSVEDGTLYQPSVNRPLTLDGEPVGNVEAYRAEKGQGAVVWRQVPLNPGQATLTYQGLQRLNAAVGLMPFQPRTQEVLVRGELRTVPNPYLEYDTDPITGAQGELLRLVMRVLIIGPTPLTGSLAAVEYVLDIQPRQHLQRALLALLNGGGGGARRKKSRTTPAADEDEDCGVRLASLAVAKPLIDAGSHAWLPLYLNLGLIADLTHPAVLMAFRDFHEQVMMEGRRAQTVILRNAMLRHPALGAYKNVAVNEQGRATVAVLAWMSDSVSRQQQQAIMRRLMTAGTTTALHEVEGVTIDQIADDGPHEPEAVPQLTASSDLGLLLQQAADLREKLPASFRPARSLDGMSAEELTTEIRTSTALIEED